MKLNETYLVFTLDHCPADAAKRYRERVGGEPKHVEVDDKHLVVGPSEPQCEETGTYHHFVDGQCEYCGAIDEPGGHA